MIRINSAFFPSNNNKSTIFMAIIIMDQTKKGKKIDRHVVDEMETNERTREWKKTWIYCCSKNKTQDLFSVCSGKKIEYHHENIIKMTNKS